MSWKNLGRKWATDVAARSGYPLDGQASLLCAPPQPHKGVSACSETFLCGPLSGQIKLTTNQLGDHFRQEVETDFSESGKEMGKSVIKSYESNFNSFYELERDYADYYRHVLRRKALHLGPVSFGATEIF
ncbi:Glycosyltransferase [Psidium guajava]|nr:Glycosyltransferase [Psidium guajava]